MSTSNLIQTSKTASTMTNVVIPTSEASNDSDDEDDEGELDDGSVGWREDQSYAFTKPSFAKREEPESDG